MMSAGQKIHQWWVRWLSGFIGIEHEAGAPMPLPPVTDKAQPKDYVHAVAVCAAATVLARALRDTLDPANLILLYLMAVAWVALRLGQRPGILASFLSVLAFDYFLVPPYHSLTVEDTQYILTFAIMLAVSLLISTLTANLRRIARIANYRERRTMALFELSRDLSAALSNEQIVDIALRHVRVMFQAEAAIFLPDGQGDVAVAGAVALPAPFAAQIADDLVRETYELDVPSSEVPADEIVESLQQVHYLPLRAPMRNRGVLVIMPEDARTLAHAEHWRLLQTCGALIAMAIERVHYVQVAQETAVAMKSEQLRNSLLNALSHDVRTPLTAIVGLSSTLTSGATITEAVRCELTEAIQEEALRMNGLVTNLLEMARLDASPVKLNRQWQLLEEVVGSSLNVMARVMAGRSVEVSLARELPPLEFDAILIERVLCNLLANVDKYTPAGSACRIEARHVGGEVQVAVVDAGPGIPAGLEKVIFEKFARTEHETSRTGAGLGLSICKAIVEAHGGRIWAENVAGGGARFVFTLPTGEPISQAAPEVDDVA